jgi:hypothetical protein
VIDGTGEERVGHGEKSTAIAAKSGLEPQWSDAEVCFRFNCRV